MKKLIFLITLGAAALYADPATIIKTKCAACHGQKMEKAALGKSGIVNQVSEKEIVKYLKGYRAGTENMHGLGATMKAQTATLSDKDIEELAKYITTELK